MAYLIKIKYYVFYAFIFLLTKTNAQHTKLLDAQQPTNSLVLLDTLTYSVPETNFNNNFVLLKIQAQKSGFLTFTILSNLPNENINFSVYKNKPNLQIENLYNYKTKPIRYNYSNSDTNTYVLTGLNKASKLYYTEKNSKNKFNSQLWVTEQEIIYLLLERKTIKKLQSYTIKFKIIEEPCFRIPITNDKGKLVTSVVEYFYDTKKWWFLDTEAKKINVCNHPEKKLHQLTVVTADYFPYIIDLKVLWRNYIDTLKLKLFKTDSIYKLQVINFDTLNKLDIPNSKISLNTYVDFIKKHKIAKCVFLYDALNSNNTAQAQELYNYFKNKFPLNIKIELLNDPSIKQNNDTGLAIKFPK